jgi:uncharacterized protein YjbI with pentapeptide repeats
MTNIRTLAASLGLGECAPEIGGDTTVTHQDGGYQRRACAALMAGLFGASLGSALAADLTARDVTLQFHQAAANQRVDLAGKDLSNLDLAGLDFKTAILTKANLYGADLSSSNLKGTDLSGAKLDRAIVIEADFSGANLAGASLMLLSVFSNDMINHAEAPKFTGANLQGSRIAARMDGADFRGADLSNSRIGPTDRSTEAGMAPSSKMLGMNFSGATMSGTDMREVDCTFCRFTGAKMAGAKLIHVDLSRADFSGADLTGADLTDSNLEGANLSGVTGFETIKGLASVRNLETAQRQ